MNKHVAMDKVCDMHIGIVHECKMDERRVALFPEHVQQLIQLGARVYVPQGLGHEVGYSHSDYAQVGAEVVEHNQAVYARAEVIIKVKEPVEEDLRYINASHTLFCYLHLASNPKLIRALLQSECSAYAFEMVKGSDENPWPLLAPMSQVAGVLAADVGMQFLRYPYGTKGLLSGFSTAPVRALVIGAGQVGTYACARLHAQGVCVQVADVRAAAKQAIDARFHGQVETLSTEHDTIAALLAHSDLVIGASLAPGLQTPKAITRDMLSYLLPGSVLVDVSIDQGGCFASSKPTTHSDPTYIDQGIIHYAVTNMPSAVATTSSKLLADAIFPWIEHFATAEANRPEALQAACMLADGKVCFDPLLRYM